MEESQYRRILLSECGHCTQIFKSNDQKSITLRLQMMTDGYTHMQELSNMESLSFVCGIPSSKLACNLNPYLQNLLLEQNNSSSSSSDRQEHPDRLQNLNFALCSPCAQVYSELYFVHQKFNMMSGENSLISIAVSGVEQTEVTNKKCPSNAGNENKIGGHKSHSTTPKKEVLESYISDWFDPKDKDPFISHQTQRLSINLANIKEEIVDSEYARSSTLSKNISLEPTCVSAINAQDQCFTNDNQTLPVEKSSNSRIYLGATSLISQNNKENEEKNVRPRQSNSLLNGKCCSVQREYETTNNENGHKMVKSTNDKIIEPESNFISSSSLPQNSPRPTVNQLYLGSEGSVSSKNSIKSFQTGDVAHHGVLNNAENVQTSKSRYICRVKSCKKKYEKMSFLRLHYRMCHKDTLLKGKRKDTEVSPVVQLQSISADSSEGHNSLAEYISIEANPQSTSTSAAPNNNCNKKPSSKLSINNNTQSTNGISYFCHLCDFYCETLLGLQYHSLDVHPLIVRIQRLKTDKYSHII